MTARNREVRPLARLLLYGVMLVVFGLFTYLVGVALSLPRYLVGNPRWFRDFNDALVWYSGLPIVVGVGLSAVDLFLLLGGKRSPVGDVRNDSLTDRTVVVALTAYNDEDSIDDAVRDFITHPMVREVIVVSNNSSDATLARAAAAGATALNEPLQGYGQCVYRCLRETVTRDCELVVLCEGDRTFRAYDLEKFLCYAPHADVVNGTRTVERLRARTTQLSTFMYYGNFFVGKLLEAKHVGRSTITDVGTTYKLCRRDALLALLPRLDPAINLEFNAYFLDRALDMGLDIVECPVTFHPRVGVSKGGNINNARAMMVGLRMINGIVIGWRAPQK